MRTKCFILLALLHLKCWRVLADNSHLVNNSPESKHLGDVYLANMKQDVKPCDNFYDYVCHNWEKYNPKPLYQTLFHVEGAMERRAYETLKKHIEHSINASSEQSFIQAKDLYNVCMQGPSLGILDAKEIKKIMSKNPNWALLYPKTNQLPGEFPWQTDNRYIKLTGESALFDHKILFDVLLESGYVTEINSMLSPYGTLLRLLPWDSEKEKTELKHYLSVLKAIIKKVAPNPSDLSWDIIERDLKQVISFREKLRQVASTKKKSIRRDINKFQEAYDSLPQSRDGASMVWLQQIRAIYKKPGDSQSQEISPKDTVHVNIAYIINLVTLLASTETRIIVNHIHLYFLERHLNLDAEILEDLEKSFSNRAERTGIIRTYLPKWRKCFLQSNLQIPLGKMYVQSSFKKETNILVKKLLNHAKALLVKEIVTSKWLDSESKKNSVTKLQNIRDVIGYPNWYFDTSAVLPHYHGHLENPLHVDVIYEPDQLVVTAGALQWPMYSPNLPYVIDYGSTVSMLAHELYHAFDQIGVTEHCPKGHYKCWSKNAITEFTKRTKCFEDQYIGFKKQECQKYKIPYENALVSTLNEDMADVMGLKLAYKGYKVKILENKGACPILPKFTKFTCDQLFFIAFANTHCYSTTMKRRQSDLIKDSHSSFEVRVNGAVGNMKEFSAAFGCKPTDPLNLKHRCDLWD